jgi:hypothetical protein
MSHAVEYISFSKCWYFRRLAFVESEYIYVSVVYALRVPHLLCVVQSWDPKPVPQFP